MKNFIISTYNGTVPHYFDYEIKNPVIINMENIYYKDSYYFCGGSRSLNEFCATKAKIYLKFRNPLKTYRGNFRISESEYEKFLKIGKPEFYQKYYENQKEKDDKINYFINDNGDTNLVYSPMNWIEMVNCNYNFVDTEFINFMADEGKRLSNIDLKNINDIFMKKIEDIDDKNNILKYLDEWSESNIVDTKYYCECCGSKDYLHYLWGLGEISAKMLIQRHNYRILEEYFKIINILK